MLYLMNSFEFVSARQHTNIQKITHTYTHRHTEGERLALATNNRQASLYERFEYKIPTIVDTAVC